MITECLKAFKEENALETNDSDSFEIYSLYLQYKGSNISAEDLPNSVVDGSNDGGIDSFLIIVDEFVINSEEDLDAIQLNADSQLKFIIGQSKFTTSFSEDILNKLFISMDTIWDLEKNEEELAAQFNDQLLERVLWFRKLWTSATVKGSAISIKFFYSCIADQINESETFKLKKDKIIGQAKTQVHNSDVKFDLLSAEQLLALHSQKVDITLELKFKEQPSTIDYGGDNIGFIGVVKLPDYYDFITDENQVVRESIFEENVRHYQGEVDVNKKIKESLSTDLETDFWWLNNGITIIAQDVRPLAKTLHVEGVQIVNGLQTSYTIGKSYNRDETDTRSVLVKIVKSTDKETIDKIISATNRQTPVNPALLRATDDIQRKLEIFFEQKGYFYDRRKNFYKNLGKPISKIFSIQSTAQAIHAILNRKPSESRAKPTTLIKTTDSYESIFRTDLDFEAYLNACLIVRDIETKIKTSELSKSDRSLIRTFTYHTARIATSLLLSKSHPSATEIKSISLSSLTQELFDDSVENLKSIIQDFSASSATTSNSSISKSGPFEELINQQLISKFHTTNT